MAAMTPISRAIDRSSSSEAKIALFRSPFPGREDVYPRPSESRRTGRSGYAAACANECVREVYKNPHQVCRVFQSRILPVTDDVIRWHLSGVGAHGAPFVAGVFRADSSRRVIRHRWPSRSAAN